MSRNVLLLGIISFLNDVSSEMIAPVLPVFLTDVLKAGKIASGGIMGLVESASSLFKVAFGYLSDRMRQRKLFVFIGYALSTVSKAALAFSSTIYDFLALRIADRVGKGIRTAPRDAIIAESSVESGKSFGFHRALDTLGAVTGPLLAIAFLTLIGTVESSQRMLFLLSAIPAVAGISMLVLVKDKGGEIRQAIGISAFKSGELKLFFVAVLIASLGRYSYAFTIWRAEELGYTLIESIAFYAFFNLIYSISAYPAGVISDRIGKRVVVALGFALFAVTSIIFAFSRNLFTFSLAFALFGVCTAIEDTVPRAYAADLARDFEKGTIIGAYHTLYGVAVFPASLIIATIWQIFGLSYGFVYAAAMNTIAAFLLAFKHVPENS